MYPRLHTVSQPRRTNIDIDFGSLPDEIVSKMLEFYYTLTRAITRYDFNAFCHCEIFMSYSLCFVQYDTEYICF
jgi:hypothetical protein